MADWGRGVSCLTGIRRGFGSATNCVATGRGFWKREGREIPENLEELELLVKLVELVELVKLAELDAPAPSTRRYAGSISLMNRDGVSYSIRP